MLGFHAVIRSCHDGGAKRIQLAKVAVEHGAKVLCAMFVWRKFVLHIVCCRQVHHVRLHFSQKLHAGRKDKFGQIGRIDLRYRHAQPFARIVYPVFGLGCVARPFRREGHSAIILKLQACAEQGTQLVLGGDNRDAGASLVELRKDGGRTQEADVVHHHFFAGIRVEKEVAADAMHRWRTACGNRQVVRVCEGWDHRVRQPVGPGLADSLEVLHQPFGDGDLQVFRFAPIQADGNGTGSRHRIGATVCNDGGNDRHIVPQAASLLRSSSAVAGGAAEATPMCSSASFAATTTARMTVSSICPIHPTRNDSTTVNFPG